MYAVIAMERTAGLRATNLPPSQKGTRPMRLRTGGLTLALLVLAAVAAESQSFPSKVVTIIVPFSAGGPTDTITRLVGQSMAKWLGGSVIVENVAGAGGTMGPSRAARRHPTGTRCCCTTSAWRRR